MKKFFELDKPYKFEVTDLTAIIYTIAAGVGMGGGNPTILFCIGAVIGTAFSWQARRLNVILLNVALLILNIFNLIKMFS
jgi:hypothetical protein